MKNKRGQTTISVSGRENKWTLTPFIRRLAQAARLAVGVPDYGTYVQHRRERHPGEPMMSYEEFFRNRQDAKYGRGATRCC